MAIEKLSKCSTCTTTFLGEIEIEKRTFASLRALLTLIAGLKIPVSFYITLVIIIFTYSSETVLSAHIGYYNYKQMKICYFYVNF